MMDNDNSSSHSSDNSSRSSRTSSEPDGISLNESEQRSEDESDSTGSLDEFIVDDNAELTEYDESDLRRKRLIKNNRGNR